MNEVYTDHKNRKFIQYKDKIYRIPAPFDQCYFGNEPTKMMTIGNRFNDESSAGQFAKLPAFAVAIYDTIIGCGALSRHFSLVTWYTLFIEVPSPILKKSIRIMLKPLTTKGVPLLLALFLDLDSYSG